ncbi:hypothetical protein COMNV_01133 [Commensalibacter sp. Nvir]|uniref:hypothetical protein n=1 Tax=Commensalibacter sp. Nvir TaxID=3069817 RepID=UPI002D63561A|nr:hypothetical protein COMNV_01133 [Commensalibacter sp. Nvir]
MNNSSVGLDVATITSDGGEVKTDVLGNVTCDSLKTTDLVADTIECQTLTATNNLNIYELHSLYGGNLSALAGRENSILVTTLPFVQVMLTLSLQKCEEDFISQPTGIFTSRTIMSLLQ